MYPAVKPKYRGKCSSHTSGVPQNAEGKREKSTDAQRHEFFKKKLREGTRRYNPMKEKDQETKRYNPSQRESTELQTWKRMMEA